MKTISADRKIHVGALLLAACFGFTTDGSAQADNSAMIFLKDGRASEAEIVSVGAADLNFKLPGIPSIQKLPFTQIEYIEFPQPEAWIKTMEDFDNGEYEKVAEIFKQVSAQRGASTGYPAPGNFAALAMRRLIDCYRRLRDPIQIGYIFKRLDWEQLPPADREMKEIVRCWALVGDEKWDEAVAAIEETTKILPDTNPASAELNFLMALIAEGKIPKRAPETEDEFKVVRRAEEEAIVQYGRSFGIDAGFDPGMAAAALKVTIERLVGKEDRENELKAMIHLYAGLHGNGKLWTGADEYFQQLLAEKLEISAAPTAKPEGVAGPKDVQARYVRIERVADEPSLIALAEVQVISGKNNIAAIGRPSQSSEGKIGEKGLPPRLAIDGKTNPGFQAGTFSRTEKEKDPWWELDLGSMKSIEEIVIFNCKNQKGDFVNPPGTFRILLLDGDRKEVFKKEDEPSPEPKSAIKIEGGAPKKLPVGEANPAAEAKPAADAEEK